MTETPHIMSAEPATQSREGIGLREKWSRGLQHVLVYGLSATLITGPLTFGAVDPWAVLLLQGLAAGLLVVWVVQQVTTGVRIEYNAAYLPIAGFAAIVGAQLLLRSSAYAYATRVAALTYVAYAILFFLAVQVLRSEDDLKRFAGFLTLFGFAIAVFAVIQDLTSEKEIYWLVSVTSGGFIYGPYVNHNHYAGLMEMLAAFPLVLSTMETLSGPKRVLLGFGGVFMAVTIFLSLSRGGMTAFALEITFLAAVLFWRNSSKRVVLSFAAVCTLILIALLWLGGQRLVQRFVSFRTDEASYHARVLIARDGLKMIKDKPVIGWGLGTFTAVYPQYRTFYTSRLVNAAHNDYVQVLADTGLLGFSMVLWFLFLVYGNGLRKIQTGDIDLTRAVSLAALTGCTGILIHSFVDFNLQIPGNAALFYVLCAVASTRLPAASPALRRAKQL